MDAIHKLTCQLICDSIFYHILIDSEDLLKDSTSPTPIPSQHLVLMEPIRSRSPAPNPPTKSNSGAIFIQH